MSDIRDDTTPPGHGYAERFPLDPAETIARLERTIRDKDRQIDVLRKERESQANRHLQAVGVLGAARDVLRQLNTDGHVIARIEDIIGTDSTWIEQRRPCVPISGGE